MGDWRARLERRAAVGHRGPASSGDREGRLGFTKRRLGLGLPAPFRKPETICFCLISNNPDYKYLC